MNYYKNIAEMLGVELNEEFMLKDKNNNVLSRKYKFTDKGLMTKFFKEWDESYNFDNIIRGHLTIVKLPWKPEMGMPYWYYSEGWKEGTINQWQDDLFDLLMWKAGNCFHTKEEAEEKGKVALEELRKEYKES